MTYYGLYQKLLWSLLRRLDASGQEQIGSHCIMDRYSGIEFAFAQKRADPDNDHSSFRYRLKLEGWVGGWWHFASIYKI